MTITDPEQYPLPPTNNVPNNPLPALVYRNVLPTPYTSESAKQFCESHGWEKRGEWGTITNAHFHPNTHECYAIIQGSSRLVLGRPRPIDGVEGKGGVEFDVSTGDVVVVPAGVSHRSLTSEGGYRYIGVYPETAPKWRNLYCRGEEEIENLKKEIRAVGVPEQDPVYGVDGPLVRIWREAERRESENEISPVVPHAFSVTHRSRL
ncbi:hypothetical protein HBH70_067570 [Parastagonospora nodorum]|nr:hypothetical protein HBH50_134600 [Parastagonospora nodorum]KAH4085318.1 hypothetical protein HBH48_159370 [Parastagonospora nodorum]KAH5142766.1 hypothetical protein HBH70_067570 [Parastagonospora nodorum]